MTDKPITEITRDEADEALSLIWGNEGSAVWRAYVDRANPGHASAVRKISQLFWVANDGKAAAEAGELGIHPFLEDASRSDYEEIYQEAAEFPVGPLDESGADESVAAGERVIEAMREDKDFMAAYADRDHPDHYWAVGEMNRAYRYAEGEDIESETRQGEDD